MPSLAAWQRELLRLAFDTGYYLSQRPDLAGMDIDLLDHFLAHGIHEGVDPCPSLNIRWYLADNPDVARDGIDPFLHYVMHGRGEGRPGRRPLDAERAVLDRAAPPRARALAWLAAPETGPRLDASALRARLDRAQKTPRLVLVVSHDDYATSCGGVQLLIADEQARFAAAGTCVLHLSPASPLPLLADAVAAEDFALRLRLDGEAIGAATMAAVIDAVASPARGPGEVELVVHHLLGHAPELIAALAAAAAARPVLWIHDFFTLCPSYALMRNDVQFCGGPPVRSAACTVCCAGEERLRHLPRMARFFGQTRPEVLAPSATMLAHWRRLADLPFLRAAAWPLARPLFDPEPITPSPDGVLRIAHVGARSLHKGWMAFDALAQAFACDPRYAFLHLGDPYGPPLPGCIRQVPVLVTPAHRRAMIEAIAAHGIDVVVVWSLWPEAFCYVAHEALVAGAFVVARAAAGHVWPAILEHAPEQGATVQDEPALHAMLADGTLAGRVRASPRRRGALVPVGDTASWIAWGRALA